MSGNWPAGFGGSRAEKDLPSRHLAARLTQLCRLSNDVTGFDAIGYGVFRQECRTAVLRCRCGRVPTGHVAALPTGALNGCQGFLPALLNAPLVPRVHTSAQLG